MGTFSRISATRYRSQFGYVSKSRKSTSSYDGFHRRRKASSSRILCMAACQSSFIRLTPIRNSTTSLIMNRLQPMKQHLSLTALKYALPFCVGWVATILVRNYDVLVTTMFNQVMKYIHPLPLGVWEIGLGGQILCTVMAMICAKSKPKIAVLGQCMMLGYWACCAISITCAAIQPDGGLVRKAM